MHRATLVLAAFPVLCFAAAPAGAQCDAYVLRPTLHSSGADPRGVAFGKLDADAYVDLVVPDFASQGVKVLYGTPGGGFAAPVSVAAGTGPLAVALGDLDGDGDLDVAVCDEGVLVGSTWQSFGFTVLWNTNGGFPTSSFVPLPAGQIQPRDVALGDFDGDNDLDVALVLHGTGTNNSQLASFLNLGGHAFAGASLAHTNFDPVAMAVGDVNGDQILDVVNVSSFSGFFSILDGAGDGTFTQVFGHAVGAYPQDVTLGDFDGDGDLDGAIAYRYGVHVLENTAGILNWTATLSAGLYPYAVACADLDGDGDLDLAAADGLGDTLYVWNGDGAGAFALRTSFVVGNEPARLAAYDVDLDGDPDLGVVAYQDGGVVVLDNACPLSTYCVGKRNSLRCAPSIGSTGTPSLSGPDDFHVTATQELANKAGLVFFGVKAAAKPFAGGTLCVKPPVVRTPVQNSGGTPGQNCTGTYDYHVLNAWLTAKGWSAGMDVFAQCWGRDPQQPDGSGVSLSNALRFELAP